MATKRKSALDVRVQQIIEGAAEAISQAIREGIAAQVAEVLGAPRSNGHTTPALPSKQQRTYPEHCIYPNCNLPHKGPRFSFLCPSHAGIPKAEKKKLLEAKQ